ncbi:MAG: histidine phosphatase family protein, partial [Hyphomicrobiaceae bacterium]
LSMPDLDRMLTPRGRKSALRMGQYIHAENLIPDYVVCSSATRTRQTHEVLLGTFARPVPVQFEPLIYEAPYERLLAVIQRCPDSAETVLILGHNPGLEDLTDALMMTADPAAEKRFRFKYPTCALSVLAFKTSHWEDLTEHSGHLERFVAPKHLE